jgi:hypothetical protein
MSLQRQQVLSLSDNQGRNLGRVAVERIEGDLVFGRFLPGPDYDAVGQLFADYVEAANDQLLSLVGDLDEVIAGLGLHLRSATGADLPDIHDVQIGGERINFRTRPRDADAKPPDRRKPALPADAAPPEPRAL